MQNINTAKEAANIKSIRTTSIEILLNAATELFFVENPPVPIDAIA